MQRINLWCQPNSIDSEIKWPSECEFVGSEPIRFSSLREAKSFYFKLDGKDVLIKRDEIKIITYERTNPMSMLKTNEGILITLNSGKAYFIEHCRELFTMGLIFNLHKMYK